MGGERITLLPVCTRSYRSKLEVALAKVGAGGAGMDSEHARGGEHPKIIGPPNPEHKLQTILETVGKTVAAIEYGEVESSRGMHEAEAVVFHFTDGTALAIEIGSKARDLSASRDLTPPDVHTDLMPFWSHRVRPND